MAVATYTSSLRNLELSSRVGNMADNRYARGNVYCMTDVCYAANGGDAGSTLVFGSLPKGAVPLYAIVYPVNGNGVPTAMENAVTGSLGVSGDADLFGAVGSLKSATPQVVVPKPDGTVYTGVNSIALNKESSVVLTTAAAALTAGEGVAVKIFFTYV
ncbi:MAG TPA: hypothetical protein PLR31_09975 [Anaerohalosphaeraceae bacterium]|nr:hypothetical protein [Anaerohalosphaeraceae bacterium]